MSDRSWLRISRFWGILSAIVFLPLAQCVPGNHIVKTFMDPTGDNTTVNNHLVVHKDTGILYVGSVNRIYQLDPNLQLIAVNKTGPYEDSPECSGYLDCPPRVRTSLTSNVNKALVVDYSRAKLIACGSLYQGSCSIIGLDNVSTSESEFIGEPIVANNETASTVAFIAPGPPPVTTVLYVGVTYTGNSPYRHEVPAVSSRSLNPRDNFQIIQTSRSSGTKIHFGQRDSYPIHYVYGFSSEGFSYFMTVQKKDVGNSPFISKLVRVCQNDTNYYSYTEIPIECVSETTGSKFDLVQAAFVGKSGPDLANKLDVTHQDDVLFAVFSRAENPGSSLAGKESALCVYSLKDIRRKFVENIELCFQGKGNRGLGFISMNAPCVPTKLKIIEEDFCGIDVNDPLGGEKPVLALSVLNFTTQLTSVAAMSTGNYTVVFLGTKNGHLKKVVVDSGKSGTEYGDLDIDSGSRVLPDMFFDPQKFHLYVMTEKKISKVLVQICSEYTTCKDCLDAGDPYCGWCSLQNKSTMENVCPISSKVFQLSTYWLSYKSGQCARITMVRPNQLQRSTTRTLTINIDHLSTRYAEFWCVFQFASGKKIKTHANLTTHGVICYTPPTSDLPLIPPQQHNFTTILAVQMLLNGSIHSDFLAPDFVFFDCSTYTTCTSCVTSAFPCDWCADKHMCTHNTDENCRNDILVTGLNRVGPSIRSGPNFCPRINIFNGSPELLVPYGTQKRIKVKVDNIAQQIIVQTRFVCRFNIEGRVMFSNAQLVDATLYCNSIPFTYSSNAPNITVPLAVLWDGGKTIFQRQKFLDNPDNVHIIVYKCLAMADNCGICLIMDEKFGCGWCQSFSRCQLREQCVNDMGIWLSRTQTCPNPEIHSFYPKSGPWEGGTNVTIEGINLGKTFDDIYSGVTVAGVSCKPYRHLYSETRKIVCRLDEPSTKELKAGPVIVKVANFRAESMNTYGLVDPKINSITPTMGPMNGGTRLTIFGEHLNAGKDVQAFVGNIQCEIILKEYNRLECRTGGLKLKNRLRVIVKFDQRERIYEPGFSYVDNPVIIFDRDNPIRGIFAGGLNVSIEGMNFDVIQDSQMYVFYNGSKYTSSCNVSSSNTMFCISPTINEKLDFYEINGRNTFMQLQYGFLLDTFNYNAFNITENNHPFLLFPNPQFDRFDGGMKEYKGDYLTLNGQNLNHVINEIDLVVLIGSSICNVTSLSRKQLTCKPPLKQPLEIDDSGKVDATKLPRVKVKIGQHLVFVIGKLKYIMFNFQDKQSSWTLQFEQIILVTVIPVLITIGLVILAMYFIRNFYRQNYLKKSEIDAFFIGSQVIDANENDESNMAHNTAYDKDKYEIDYDSFLMDESSILGSGEFGMVCRGTIKTGENEGSMDVAVKTVNPRKIHKTTLNGLLSEIKLLAYIGLHPNIIALIGANTADLKNGKIFIFLELCELGSLLKYLHNKRSALQTQERTKSLTKNECLKHSYVNQKFEMTAINKSAIDISLSEDLYRLSKEICSAMTYLASKHVVHADLAARNILLNSNNEAKICDFGLSRRMYNYADYVKQQQEPLPWKWMSPESLRLCKFNEKSDVWAYGVTLWEIYTLGDSPYPGKSWDINFAALLENGFRLNEPTYNQNGMYGIMKKCWNTHPLDRPAFSEVTKIFDEF